MLLFGAYALADGVIAVTHAVRGATGGTRGLLLLVGIAGIALGIAALVWPGITAFVLLMLIAAWAVAVGVLEIVVALAMQGAARRVGLHPDRRGLAAVRDPAVRLAGLRRDRVVWLIGLLAILSGAAMLGAAFRLRRPGRRAERHARTTPATRH